MQCCYCLIYAWTFSTYLQNKWGSGLLSYECSIIYHHLIILLKRSKWNTTGLHVHVIHVIPDKHFLHIKQKDLNFSKILITFVEKMIIGKNAYCCIIQAEYALLGFFFKELGSICTSAMPHRSDPGVRSNIIKYHQCTPAKVTPKPSRKCQIGF